MKEKKTDIIHLYETRPMPFYKFIFTVPGLVILSLSLLFVFFNGAIKGLLFFSFLCGFYYRLIGISFNKIDKVKLNDLFLKRARKTRKDFSLKGWRVKRKQKLLRNKKNGSVKKTILAIFFILFFISDSYADTIIYVYSKISSQGIYKKVKENREILKEKARRAPNSVKYLEVAENKNGKFDISDVKGNIKGTYDDMLYALIKTYEMIPNEERVWIFFSSHSVSENTFFVSSKTAYTISNLYSFLSLGYPVYFLGLDVCDAGTIKNLKYLMSSQSVKYVAGSEDDIMDFGFRGVYRKIDEIIRKPVSIPEKIVAYYMLFSNEIIESRTKEFLDSGFRCVSINVYSKSGVLNRGMTCYAQK